MIQKIKQRIRLTHFKSNRLFFLSGFCFFLLVFQFDRVWEIISVFSLLIAIFLSLFYNNPFSRFKQSAFIVRIFSVAFALIFSYVFIRKFISTWFLSGKIEKLASTIHLSNTIILSIISIILSLLSLPFLSTIFNLILVEIKKFTNIKSNILLIISAFVFMGLNIQFNRDGIFAMFLSYLMIILLFSQIKLEDIKTKLRNSSWIIKIYSLISTIGICYYSCIIFIESLQNRYGFIDFLLPIHICLFFTIILLISCITVFIFVDFLLDYVVNKLKKIFQCLSKIEKIIYLLITVLLFIFVGFAFTKSNAFWGTNIPYDIIYTSDSSFLVNKIVYLLLYHPENDLRQPLFGIFSAPFVGFGYALSIPFSTISPVFPAIFMNFIQIILLVITNLMLSNIFTSNKKSRICFMLISTATYTTLLFSIMMEQYIVSFFWLVFVIYCYMEHNSISMVSWSAAGGTLLTSWILLPFLYPKSNSNPKTFIDNIKKNILCFIILMLLFGRLDIFLNCFDRINLLKNFTGSTTMKVRILQYLSFVSSCFLAPNASIDSTKHKYISWQLSNITMNHINKLGLILLLLCVVSFIINKKNTLTKISGFWVCFSIILLVVVGWGSLENGMILYSLYFGWAFLVLLFQLIEWVSKKLKFELFTTIVSGTAIILLGILNYQGITELLNFAFTYYPVR